MTPTNVLMKLTPLLASAILLSLAAPFTCRADERSEQREKLTRMLGIPARGGELSAESRGQLEHEGVIIEKWVFTAEPGSRVPALLYRPRQSSGRLPAIVFTYGHGSSKSAWSYHYAGLLYAKLGLAALAIDPIGEEERHLSGRMGSRAHDHAEADARAAKTGRLMMGKLVFDTMRGLDLLATRADIDLQRIGVVGYSLGGAKASWMAALETRLRLALVCGWAYDDAVLPTKLCTKVPFTRMRARLDWPAFISLAAPHCAILTANGDHDVVIDRGDRDVWPRTAERIEAAKKNFSDGMLATYLEREGGHRPYFLYKEPLLFACKHLTMPDATSETIRGLPLINLGDWCDQHRIPMEKLYGIPLHWRGATAPDLALTPLAPEKLAVLRADEKGSPDVTLEGWLDQIEGKRGSGE